MSASSEGSTSAPGRHGLRRAFQSPVQEPLEKTYAECRTQFRSGDLLCFKGTSLFSRIIRLVTRSYYSHSGLLYWHRGFEQPRLYCVESTRHGVRLVLMSELDSHYDGGIDYFTIDHTDGEGRNRAIGFCFEHLGQAYDVHGVLRFFWAFMLGRIPEARENDRWFCSELTAAAYHSQGIPLVPRTPDYTSPHDISESEHVTYRLTLKPE